ncbi:hypothetical protein O7608_29350 [Solwaraspora sp. WMMA2056]|uniref:hypothetical protein n=1 Tax=Solwaraspora sp. WMMA2056 TaxID=3015161 RepID=UPI00259B293D|nr:hypothetical protein [Solwaraspora sp. WMMA2056]WJK40454.1 hypothetical protein O7608_29350 [Solwaraspora sp. WMMA2056]
MDHGRDGLELSIGYPTSKPTRLAMFSVLGALAVMASCVGGGVLGAMAGDGTGTIAPMLVGGGLAAGAATVMGLPIARTARTGAWLAGTRLTVRGLVSRTVDLTVAESVTLRTAPDPTATAADATGTDATGTDATAADATAADATAADATARDSATPASAEPAGTGTAAAGPSRSAPSRRRSAAPGRRSAPVAPRTPTITVVGPDGTVTLPLRSRDGTMLPGAEMVALARAFSAASCPGAHEAVHWLHTMGSEPRTAGVGL